MSSFPNNRGDGEWMGRALALARRGEGLTRPNPPVGAVVARSGRCLAEGFHRKAGGDHAEIVALKKAGAKARGATLYVTLEPCCTQGRTGPCTRAIIRSGIRRVVAAVKDPNPRHEGKGFRILRKAGIAVTEGVGRKEAETILRPFAKWVRTGMPYVTLKMGMSLDGKIADGRGRSRWITGPGARKMVGNLRKRVDAILVGSRTVNMDNPGLLSPSPGRTTPYRVIADSSGRTPMSAKVLNDAYRNRTILAVTGRCPARRRKEYEARAGRVLILPEAGGHVSLRRLLSALGRMGILHVVCEGGGDLAFSLIRAGLVDEYLFFVAPKLLGGRAAPTAVGGAGWRLGKGPILTITECRRVGADILVRGVEERHKGTEAQRHKGTEAP